MTKRNYTLIELLTVIFIIAVLAGLIIPGMAMVRARAKRLNCASNLKQVGALCMQFSNDRDGQIPMYKYEHKTTPENAYNVRDKNIENYHRKEGQTRFEAPKKGTEVISSTANRVYWTVGLLRYAKYNMSVFFCPSDERDVNVFDFSSSGNASYSLNYGDANRPGGVEDGSSFVKMTLVTRSPAGVILLGETDTGKLGMKSSESSFFDDNFKTPLKRKPHSNEFNTSFLDGHVDSLRTSDLQEAFNRGGYKIVP